MAKTREKTYCEMLDEALSLREDYEAMWEAAENVYEGNYEPLQIGMWDFAGRVKSHLLFDAVRKNTSLLMPPGYIDFVVEASDQSQTADINSAATAKPLLEYHFNKRGGMPKLRESITDMLLLNRGYVRVGFKVDGGITPDEGEDKMDGQAFFERIHRKDFVISRGALSIDEAWSNGGWVARRFWANIDWVKNNPEYSHRQGSNAIKADAEWKGKKLDDQQGEMDSTEGVISSQDLKYVELWEIFEAPTNKNKDGKYTIFSKRQEKVMYEKKGMPFEGIKVPIREISFFTPREGYYATPLSTRSINPMLEHEWFETEKIRALYESFDLIAVDGLAADEIEDALEGKSKNVKYLNVDGLQKNTIQHEVIRIDPSPYDEGSANARARFDRMWGLVGSDQRQQGGKIATEMVLQSKIQMAETNDLRVRVNQFIEQIALDLLTIDKQLMSPKMQELITRSANKIWQDMDEITLEGNFSVMIKSKPLRDMTEGEYGQQLQGVANFVLQLEQLPKYSSVANAGPIIKAMLENADVPLAGVWNDQGPMADQNFETQMMLMGIPMDVKPEDDDIDHLNDLQTTFQAIEQTGEQGAYNPKFEELAQQHVQQHQQQLQQKQGGSAGATAQQFNGTNNARQDEAADMSGGATGTQQVAQAGATI